MCVSNILRGFHILRLLPNPATYIVILETITIIYYIIVIVSEKLYQIRHLLLSDTISNFLM